MTDNTVINLGVNGDTIATDDIGGIKYQRVKACYGPDGSSTDTSYNTPFPVAIKYADSPAVDAFGKLRVANGNTIFDSKQIDGLDSYGWVNKIVNNSGNAALTFNTNQASVALTVGIASGDRVVNQTRRRMNYQPGKSFLMLCTGVMGHKPPM